MNRLQFNQNDWSPKILQFNLKLSEYFGEMANPVISQETIEELQQYAKKDEAFFSTKIEGNITTREDAEKAMETKNVKALKRSREKEFKNYFDVLEFIEKNLKKSDKITPEFICACHKLLMRDIPVEEEGDETPGVYRKRGVKITGAEHIPRQPALIDADMNQLLNYINDCPYVDLFNAVAIFHHRFVWIHPFNNGNGRLARALSYAILRKYGKIINQMISASTSIAVNKKNYYKCLAEADKTYETYDQNGTCDKNGIRIWIEYYLDALYKEARIWKRRLAGTQLEAGIKNILHDLVKEEKLSEMESTILFKVIFDGRIKSEGVQEKLRVNKDEAYRLLTGLVQKGELKEFGETKGRYYKMNVGFRTPLVRYFFPREYLL